MVSLQQGFAQALYQITTQLKKPSLDSIDWNDISLGAIGKCCQELKKSEGLYDYKLMLLYLQLMLTCDGYYKEAHWQGEKGLSVEDHGVLKIHTFYIWHQQLTMITLHKYVVLIYDMLDKAEVNYKMVPVHIIKTGFCVPTDCCPFNTKNAPEWTATERETALNVVPVSNLSKLEKLDGFYN
ncbi:hypothetical protein ARMGADRAFT_1035924 [Armillaria gallica]|uniref:Uncharacterized protein n=1 Tax=Armillaria gallica TaxID=47427 RepID=A0A2H3CWS8_ARMGA|nr:hypothetical protein ARMGADRAFT_1035924 [Armillaria gallica]